MVILKITPFLKGHKNEKIVTSGITSHVLVVINHKFNGNFKNYIIF
jgi:hypothetical protein